VISAAAPKTHVLAGQDVAAVASALTWLGERLYYLAAISAPPFDNQDTLVSTLLRIWTSARYEGGT
jgi:TetR/AcrR family transcriptional regulator, ethionamide resistance regulator